MFDSNLNIYWSMHKATTIAKKNMSSIVSTRRNPDISTTKGIFVMIKSIQSAQKTELSNILYDLRNGKKDKHWIWYPFTTDLVGQGDPYGLGLPEEPNSLLAFALFTKNDAFFKIMNRIIECIEKTSFMEVFQVGTDRGRIQFWVKYWSQVIEDCKGTQFYDTFNRFVKAMHEPSASKQPRPLASNYGYLRAAEEQSVSKEGPMTKKITAKRHAKEYLGVKDHLQPSTERMLLLVAFHEDLPFGLSKKDIIRFIMTYPGYIAVTGRPSNTDKLGLCCLPDDMRLLAGNPHSKWICFLDIVVKMFIEHGFKTMVPNEFHQGRFGYFVEYWKPFAEKTGNHQLLSIVYCIARSMYAGGVDCHIRTGELFSMFPDDATNYHN